MAAKKQTKKPATKTRAPEAAPAPVELRVVREFNDRLTGELRKVGGTFFAESPRLEELLAADGFVEVVEQPPADGDAEVREAAEEAEGAAAAD